MNRLVKPNVYNYDHVISGKNKVKINTICCNKVYDGKKIINIEDLKGNDIKVYFKFAISGVTYELEKIQPLQKLNDLDKIKCLNDSAFVDKIKKYNKDDSSVKHQYYVTWLLELEPAQDQYINFIMVSWTLEEVVNVLKHAHELEGRCYVGDFICLNHAPENDTVDIHRIKLYYDDTLIFNHPTNDEIIKSQSFKNGTFYTVGSSDSKVEEKLKETIHYQQAQINIKDNTILDQQNELKEKDNTIQEQQNELNEKDSTIEVQLNEIYNKDEEISELTNKEMKIEVEYVLDNDEYSIDNFTTITTLADVRKIKSINTQDEIGTLIEEWYHKPDDPDLPLIDMVSVCYLQDSEHDRNIELNVVSTSLKNMINMIDDYLTRGGGRLMSISDVVLMDRMIGNHNGNLSFIKMTRGGVSFFKYDKNDEFDFSSSSLFKIQLSDTKEIEIRDNTISELRNKELKIEVSCTIDDVEYTINNFVRIEDQTKVENLQCLNETGFKDKYNEWSNKIDDPNLPTDNYIMIALVSNPENTSDMILIVHKTSFKMLLQTLNSYDMNGFILDFILLDKTIESHVGKINQIQITCDQTRMIKYPLNYEDDTVLNFDNDELFSFELCTSKEIDEITNQLNQLRAENISLKEEQELNKPSLTIEGFLIQGYSNEPGSSEYYEYDYTDPVIVDFTPLKESDLYVKIPGSSSDSGSVLVLLLYQNTDITQQIICFSEKADKIRERISQLLQNGAYVYHILTLDLPAHNETYYYNNVMLFNFDYTYKFNKNISSQTRDVRLVCSGVEESSELVGITIGLKQLV